MTRGITPRWFVALYRALLSAAPAEFRRRYGQEVVAVAARRVSDRPRRSRWLAAMRELSDLTVTIRRERRAARGSRPARDDLASRRASTLDVIAQDVRGAVRSLRTSPGFTAVALTILTLGIGASAAIFSVVDAVVLRGLPFDEGDRIVQIGHVSTVSLQPMTEVPQAFLDLRDEQHVFDQLAATASTTFTPSGTGETDPEALPAIQVLGDLFPLLRVQPQLGRAFTSADDVNGRDHVVVISDGLWRRRFAADPGVLGKTLRTDNAVFEIIGVMPRGFAYPLDAIKPAEVWMPYAPTAAERTHGRARGYGWLVVGRVKAGIAIGQAGAEMQQIGAALDKAYPGFFSNPMTALTHRSATEIGVTPLADAIVRNVRSWMLLLLGTVGLVLLIACVNVANLMMARATTRHRELAVRAALGGTRWRIARALLVESLVLSAIGTALGVMVAYWGVAVLKASMPVAVPRLSSIAIDLRVLVAAAMTATATGVLFGLMPALQASRVDLTHALKEGTRATLGRAKRQFRAALVIAEVSLAVILLVGAGLFISSFVRVMTTELGFDDTHVLTASAYIDFRNPAWKSTGRQFMADAVNNLGAIDGVVSAAAVADDFLPLMSSGYSRQAVVIPTRPDFQPTEEIDQRQITPDYFKVLRMPLLRGRAFDTTDTPASPPVIMINDVAARNYFEDRDALGQTMTIGGANVTVVGVVRGVRVGGPETDVRPQGYAPISQSEVHGGAFVIRTSGDPTLLADAMKAAIRQTNPAYLKTEIRPLESYFADLVAQRKFNMQLIGLFGLLGIAIAGVGIYGVMAYIVSQQTGEIGIRMALGALPFDVLGGVLSRATSYVLAGLAIGTGGAWMLSRFAAAFLFHVQPHDPIVYIAVAAVLVTAGLIAAIVPARRAAQVNPVIALRHE